MPPRTTPTRNSRLALPTDPNADHDRHSVRSDGSPIGAVMGEQQLCLDQRWLRATAELLADYVPLHRLKLGLIDEAAF